MPIEKIVAEAAVKGRAAERGILINWAIDKVLGISFITGTAIWPNCNQQHPPHAENIRMQLLWWSHGVFGCHDGKSCFKGHTHTFKQGAAALDPFPYLTHLALFAAEPRPKGDERDHGQLLELDRAHQDQHR